MLLFPLHHIFGEPVRPRGVIMGDRYRFGLYLNPQPGDCWTSDLAEAERLAKTMSIHNNGTPVAVWDENNQTVKLFAGYEEFVPAR